MSAANASLIKWTLILLKKKEFSKLKGKFSKVQLCRLLYLKTQRNTIRCLCARLKKKLNINLRNSLLIDDFVDFKFIVFKPHKHSTKEQHRAIKHRAKAEEWLSKLLMKTFCVCIAE
jgi:hypothetical protein